MSGGSIPGASGGADAVAANAHEWHDAAAAAPSGPGPSASGTDSERMQTGGDASAVASGGGGGGGGGSAAAASAPTGPASVAVPPDRDNSQWDEELAARRQQPQAGQPQAGQPTAMATAAAAPSVRRDTDDKADDAMRSSLSSTAALRPHHKKDPGQYSPYQLDGHPAAAATNRSLAAAATTIGTAKDGATAHEILAAEERRQRKKQEQAEMDHGAGHHKWADHVPLPYWLVVPKELRQKVAAEDLESQEQQGDSSGPNGRDHELVLRQARVNFLRRLLAEMVGACVLAGVHSFLRVRDWQGELSGGDVGVFGGLTLVILVYSIGEISGAHFNPVITMAFTMRRIFPAVWLLPYWAAQIVGAICAGGIIRGFFGPLAGKGTSYVETETSRFTPVSGMMFEVCITFMLAFTALSVCTRGSIVGVHAALAVGAVVGMNIGLGSGITGGCMNPARVLGPAIINGPWDTIWAVIVGPFIGGLIAVIIHAALSGRPPHVAKKPAMGDGKECEA